MILPALETAPSSKARFNRAVQFRVYFRLAGIGVTPLDLSIRLWLGNDQGDPASGAAVSSGGEATTPTWTASFAHATIKDQRDADHPISRRSDRCSESTSPQKTTTRFHRPGSPRECISER